jgi:hypothetical protein
LPEERGDAASITEDMYPKETQLYLAVNADTGEADIITNARR